MFQFTVPSHFGTNLSVKRILKKNNNNNKIEKLPLEVYRCVYLVTLFEYT